MSIGEFATFFDELSSGAPVPGGGSVAALEAAMAASLLAMVANLTLGNQRYERSHPTVRALLERCLEFQKEALELADDDVRAYAAVSECFSLPRRTDGERAVRLERLQTALKDAVAPPFRTMALGAELVELARGLVPIGNRSAISDIGVAVMAARASFYSGRLNVEINLQSIRDTAWTQTIRGQMDLLPDVGTIETQVSDDILKQIHGEAG